MTKAEKYIEDGYVIGREGTWIPLAQAIAEEEQWLERLGQGKILQNGQWMSLEKVLGTQNDKDIASTHDEVYTDDDKEAAAADEYLIDQETKVFDIHALYGDSTSGDNEPSADEEGGEEPREEAEPVFEAFGSIAIEPAEKEASPPEHKPDTVRLEINLEENSEDLDTILEPQAALADEEEDAWGTAARGRHYTVMAIGAAAVAVAAIGLFLLLLIIR